MAYGLTNTEYDKLIGVLAHNAHVEKAILYGSRAKGNYKPFSDIDLTLVGSQLSHTFAHSKIMTTFAADFLNRSKIGCASAIGASSIAFGLLYLCTRIFH